MLRFLGHKLPAHGGVNGNYQGLVQSDLKQRHEGTKHIPSLVALRDTSLQRLIAA